MLVTGCGIDDREVAVASAMPGGAGSGSIADGVTGPSVDDGSQSTEGGEQRLPSGLSVEPAALDFGGVGIGTQLTALLQLRNLGEEPLTLGAPSLTGAQAAEFAITGGTCSGALDVQGSCTVEVGFSPSGEGARRAALSIPVGGSDAVRVDCSGTGLDSRDLRADAVEMDFGSVEVDTESATRDWVITNEGVGRVASLSLGPFDDENFRLDNGCSDGLDAGASCRIGVTFTPREAGLRRSNVTLTGSGGGALGLSFYGTSPLRVQVQVTGPGRVVTSASSPFQIDCGALCDALLLPPVTGALQPLNDLGFVFKSWVHNPDCGGGIQCAVSGDTKSLRFIAEFAAPTHNLVFISSARFTGDLGGARAYDAACSALAVESRITTQPNAFVAAVSDGASDFRDRLAPGVQGWVNAAGLPFARTASEWLDQGQVLYPIQFTELGGYASSPMTGRRADGTLENCQDWTVADGRVSSGSPGGGSEAWSDAGFDLGCADFSPIICLGNTSTLPLTAPVRTGKRIWMTRALYTPGSGDPDTLCMAERPSSVTRATALLTGRGRLYPDLIDPSVDYVRPDGLVVFDGSTPKGSSTRVTPLLRPLTGVWVDGAGRPVTSDNPYVWLGGGGSAAASAGSCVNWTQASSVERAAVADYRRLPQLATNLTCNESAHLYCIEL